MKICPTCNKEYEDDTTFCPWCGTKREEEPKTISCPSCGKEIPDNWKFCKICGADIRNVEKMAVATKIDKPIMNDVDNMVSCLGCGEMIPGTWKFCRHCGHAMRERNERQNSKTVATVPISDKPTKSEVLNTGNTSTNKRENTSSAPGKTEEQTQEGEKLTINDFPFFGIAGVIAVLIALISGSLEVKIIFAIIAVILAIVSLLKEKKYKTKEKKLVAIPITAILLSVVCFIVVITNFTGANNRYRIPTNGVNPRLVEALNEVDYAAEYAINRIVGNYSGPISLDEVQYIIETTDDFLYFQNTFDFNSMTEKDKDYYETMMTGIIMNSASIVGGSN